MLVYKQQNFIVFNVERNNQMWMLIRLYHVERYVSSLYGVYKKHLLFCYFSGTLHIRPSRDRAMVGTPKKSDNGNIKLVYK